MMPDSFLKRVAFRFTNTENTQITPTITPETIGCGFPTPLPPSTRPKPRPGAGLHSSQPPPSQPTINALDHKVQANADYEGKQQTPEDSNLHEPGQRKNDTMRQNKNIDFDHVLNNEKKDKTINKNEKKLSPKPDGIIFTDGLTDKNDGKKNMLVSKDTKDPHLVEKDDRFILENETHPRVFEHNDYYDNGFQNSEPQGSNNDAFNKPDRLDDEEESAISNATKLIPLVPDDGDTDFLLDEIDAATVTDTLADTTGSSTMEESNQSTAVQKKQLQPQPHDLFPSPSPSVRAKNATPSQLSPRLGIENPGTNRAANKSDNEITVNISIGKIEFHSIKKSSGSSSSSKQQQTTNKKNAYSPLREYLNKYGGGANE